MRWGFSRYAKVSHLLLFYQNYYHSLRLLFITDTRMAKIYYDPDKDELIPLPKGKSADSAAKSSASKKYSGCDAEDISERLERIEEELKQLNCKADAAAVQQESAAFCSEDTRYCSGDGDNQAAFLLGAYAGWKLVDEVCDSVKNVFDTGNKCCCGKKKKWF